MTPASSAPRGRGDVATLTAAFPAADGRPRFSLVLRRADLEDPGVAALVRGESQRGGYEYPTRRFLDVHLEPDDLFIDVGAHWGIFALHAATRHPGRLRVLAVEPHPGNIGQLMRNVAGNRLAAAIEVVAVAAGAAPGTAPLLFNSTMGHSLYGLGLPQGAGRLGEVTVPVLPLDLLVEERPDLARRRVVMKVDVEGFEPEVIAGAGRLLDSGRVAAVIWEHGLAFRSGERRDAMLAMCEALEVRGFRQYRFPHPTMGGPLVTFAPTPECFNVFALAPGVTRSALYDKPERRPEPLPPLERSPADADVRAATTALVIARKATDAARWADFEAMREGAAERVRLAAPLVAPASRVLDVGAGVMALRDRLPPDCRYVPSDLLPFDPATVVCDLNDGGFPDGTFDVVVLLDIIEFVHDPVRVLCAAAVAPHLITSYRPADGDAPEERRRCGYVNDYTALEIEALLAQAGWRIDRRIDGAGLRVFDCRRQ
ncbi:MAG: FkbM family methyltransferase [Rhodospirillales bacterium]